MEARSSILGDERSNHPLNWSLPERNWPASPGAVVQMSMVHAIVQLSVRSSSPPVAGDHDVVGNPRIRSSRRSRGWPACSGHNCSRCNQCGAIPILQAVCRRDHFGFVDGLSQPTSPIPFIGGVGQPWTNDSARGEILLGYPNDHGDPRPHREESARRLRPVDQQHLSRDSEAEPGRRGARSACSTAATAASGLSGDRLKEKMMGASWRPAIPS